MTDHIIVGAGISGLVCGYRLKQQGKSVLLFEAAPNAGGKILTERREGYLLEGGPNSLRLSEPEARELLTDLGLDARIVTSSPEASKRFILKSGKPVALPASPIAAITTPLFSISGKLRLLKEPIVSSANSDDESIGAFVARRFGSEALEYAADPFIRGIYAGDPDRLSLKHGMNRLWELEQQHGSVLKGMFKSRKGASKGPKASIVSFPNGLSEIVAKLHKELGSALRLNEGVSKISYSGGRFGVTTIRGTQNTESLILAAPAPTSATLVNGFAPDAAAKLGMLHYPAVQVVYLGYRREAFSTPPEGFGLLVPRVEQRKILGILYSSSVFPDRAPDGHVLLTVLMGGAADTWIERSSERDLREIAVAEVASILGASEAPVLQHSRLWKRAIPQYETGYGDILSALEQAERQHAGLHFIGNYRGGISIGACIRTATQLANRLI